MTTVTTIEPSSIFQKNNIAHSISEIVKLALTPATEDNPRGKINQAILREEERIRNYINDIANEAFQEGVRHGVKISK